ncbi:hypothetical protein D044_2065A, partial [Vibrio parahaemolyticus EKP-026]
MITVT